MNRSARWDRPVMITLLVIVVWGAIWGLVDGQRDDDVPPQPTFISAGPLGEHHIEVRF